VAVETALRDHSGGRSLRRPDGVPGGMLQKSSFGSQINGLANKCPSVRAQGATARYTTMTYQIHITNTHLRITEAG